MRIMLLATMISLAGAAGAHANPRRSVPRLVRCVDGTMSRWAGRATCAKHGGIVRAGKIPLPPRIPPPRRDTTTAGREIGARCVDGTVAKATPRSACTNHGGLVPQTSRLGEPVARCRDGAVSFSQQDGGRCSDHGGVRDWLGG